MQAGLQRRLRNGKQCLLCHGLSLQMPLLWCSTNAITAIITVRLFRHGRTSLLPILYSAVFSLQCPDTVGWVTEMASSCKKVGCCLLVAKIWLELSPSYKLQLPPPPPPSLIQEYPEWWHSDTGLPRLLEKMAFKWVLTSLQYCAVFSLQCPDSNCTVKPDWWHFYLRHKKTF